MTPILQFGTSRFLQAHADLFISQALATGQALGPITVVQTSGDPGRSRRLAALAAPGGFTVQVRGQQDGQTIDTAVQVTSVVRALSTATDWAEVRRIAVEEAQVILSNSADAGYAPQPADTGPTFDQAMSWPAKLTRLLQARFQASGRPVQVMPTELITDNGRVLRARVMELAQGAEFRDWLMTRVTWVNSLVDRIVSQPLEPAGAVAEPYALWAIEDQPGLILPCRHPAMQVVADLRTTEALKLFILNLGHTFLAQRWLDQGAPQGRFVRQVVADPVERAALDTLYRDEVVPGFAAAGLGEAATRYVATTLDRFANPFLDHRLSDIADNHAHKIVRRAGAFLSWAASHGDHAPKPLLRALEASR